MWTARRLYGFSDRGVLAPGMPADLNVIDLDGLTVRRPVAHHDLPSGAWRFLQPVSGYVATVVAGVQTPSGEADTGERPGRLSMVSSVVQEKRKLAVRTLPSLNWMVRIRHWPAHFLSVFQV